MTIDAPEAYDIVLQQDALAACVRVSGRAENNCIFLISALAEAN